jgi:RimJ/RimL family protein N-acetyltransferase
VKTARVPQGASVLLRPPQPADLGKLEKLWLSLATTEMAVLTSDRQAEPVSQECARSFLADSSAYWLLAEHEGQVAGEVRLTTSTAPAVAHRVQLSLAAHPLPGLAEALVKGALDWARTTGKTRVELSLLTGRLPAMTLLGECGFVTEGERRQALRLRDGRLYDELMMAHYLPVSGADLEHHPGRLRIEPCSPDQAERLVSWLCSQEWPFHPSVHPEPDEVRQWLEEGLFLSSDHQSLWLHLDEISEPVGLLSLQDTESCTTFDLRIAGTQRGTGIGRSALTWLADHVFTTTSRARIEGHTRIDNIGMIRVFQVLGWVREAHLRQVWPVAPGRYLDALTYAILRQDWQRYRECR